MGVAFAAMWSSAFTSARMIVADAPPLTALALRFWMSGAIGVLLALALGQSWRLTRAQWRATVAFGGVPERAVSRAKFRRDADGRGVACRDRRVVAAAGRGAGGVPRLRRAVAPAWRRRTRGGAGRRRVLDHGRADRGRGGPLRPFALHSRGRGADGGDAGGARRHVGRQRADDRRAANADRRSRAERAGGVRKPRRDNESGGSRWPSPTPSSCPGSWPPSSGSGWCGGSGQRGRRRSIS